MFQQRIKNLRDKIVKEKFDAVFVSDVSNISYLTGFTNFSKDERGAYIFVGQDFAYIITDGRYTEAVKREVLHLELFERGHDKSVEVLFKQHKKQIKNLGIEEDNLTVSEHKILRKHFSNIKHFNVGHLRSIKSEEETAKIEKACQIGDLAFDYILKKIKTGVTEKEIADELENFIKQKGAVMSFPPIVAFGKNSAVPHHQTGPSTSLRYFDKLSTQGRSGREGLTILLDFGVKYENYCSDMTRTVFFGKPTDKQKRIYKTVLEAQQKAVDFIAKQQACLINSAIKTGKQIKAAAVDKVARDYIVSKRFPTIPHSLGHGVGLEVHEHPSLSPKSKDILKKGMVFSIEPGIYIPGFGSPREARFAGEAGGVRIEDLFVLDENGLRQLTRSQKELTVI